MFVCATMELRAVIDFEHVHGIMTAIFTIIVTFVVPSTPIQCDRLNDSICLRVSFHVGRYGCTSPTIQK